MKPTKPFIECMKVLFLLFNFVFWATGLGLLGVGIWTKISLLKYMKLSTSINYDLAPYIMIGCGCFIILVGILGCWGAVKEHPWVLKFARAAPQVKLYIVILVILFIAEIAAAIAGYVLKDKLEKGLRDGMWDAMKKYYGDKKGDTKKAIDDIQSQAFKCCGVDSYKDWATVPSGGNNTVPKSCCREENKCSYNNVTGHESEIYTDGCIDAMKKFGKKNFAIIGGVALGIAVFQLLGIVCAHFLSKGLREVSTYESM